MVIALLKHSRCTLIVVIATETVDEVETKDAAETLAVLIPLIIFAKWGIKQKKTNEEIPGKLLHKCGNTNTTGYST